jgi:hypothetical protein
VELLNRRRRRLSSVFLRHGDLGCLNDLLCVTVGECVKVGELRATTSASEILRSELGLSLA